ncbi:MAG TPA: pantoate--beta-alanine ligase, partial [Candidatus Eisenbacteria bacterium]
LQAALRAGAALVRSGERRSATVLAAVRRRLAEAPLFRPQYIELVDALTLAPVDRLSGRVILAAAGFLGKARLIDNIPLTVPGSRARRKAIGEIA